MKLTVETGQSGPERTDEGTAVTVRLERTDCQFFMSEHECQLTFTDGADILTIETTRAVAQMIFGRLGDALHGH